MESNPKRSRIALAIVMTGALVGSAVTTAVLVDRADTDGIAVAPAGNATDDVGESERRADVEANEADDDAAADGNSDTAPTEPTESAGDDEAPEPARANGASEDAAAIEHYECTGDDWEPDPDEIASANADAQGLIAVLAAAGIEHEVETDRYGFVSVRYDYNDAVAQATTNSYYHALYPPEPISPHQLERMNADNAALGAAFDVAGVDYGLVSDLSGWEWVEFDWEDPVAQQIADDFYAEHTVYDEVPAEELERMRSENAGLIERFEAAGIGYTLATDPAGWEWIEYDYEDPAAQEVADAYYAELYPPEPVSEQDLARIREENAALIAALEAAGVSYELVTDPSGWEWVEYDWDDPTAQDAADAFYAEFYDYEGCEGSYEDWQPTAAEVEAANADVAAMATTFDTAGVAYTVESDEHGFTWLEWDYEDRAAQDAADSYWEQRNDAMVARVAAELDVLEEAFVAEGIAFERLGGSECETILFDTSDPAALAAVASI